MTTIQLANLALLKAGVSKAIANINEQTREAYTVRQVFDHLLRKTLRQFPWSFATKYLALMQTQGPTTTDATNVQAWASAQIYAVGDIVSSGGTIYTCILAHTAASPTNNPPNATYWSTDSADFTDQSTNDWTYAYRWPTDCLFARRIVPEGGRRQFDENPIAYRIGRDANGLLIYTNQTDAELEYTVIDCDHLWADDLYIDCFTWNLAGFLSWSLSRDTKLSQFCYAMAVQTFNDASTVSSREQQQSKDGDASWTNAR